MLQINFLLLTDEFFFVSLQTNSKQNKKFVSTVGFTNKLVTTAASGTMPVTGYLRTALEIVVIGFCRLCTAIFLTQCHQIIDSKAKTKDQKVG